MAPSSTDLIGHFSLTDRDRDRLARAFYQAKASEYRATLHELRTKFGDDKRVVLSRAIREGLQEEANQHAAQVVDTMNGYLRGELDRTEHLPEELRARRIEGYMRARGQARADLIARTEVATAKLDATLGFYRENGVEPEVHFVGPKPQCPTCAELMATNPHSMEKALSIGLPHINCRHTWRAKGVRRTELQGGLRQGRISAGRGELAGVINSDPLVNRAGSSEAAAALLRTLSYYGDDPSERDRIGRFKGDAGAQIAKVEEEIEALLEELGAEEGFKSGRVTAPKQRKLAKLYERRRELRAKLDLEHSARSQSRTDRSFRDAPTPWGSAERHRPRTLPTPLGNATLDQDERDP